MSFYTEKKCHSNLNNTKSSKNHCLKRADFGIKAVTFGTLTKTQYLLLQSLLKNKLKTLFDIKAIKVKFPLLLNLNFTSLGLEARMGKGKGNLVDKLSIIKPGQIIFTFSGISQGHLALILKFLKNKISFKLKLTSIKY